MFGIVGATALTLLAGFLGPSAVTLTLGPRDSYLPPWYLPSGLVKPNEWFVSILIWTAIILGALGLWVGLRAMADGWRPKFKKFFALGTVLSLLTICVPPMTSADVLMYAAYGRLQAIGRSPYEITAGGGVPRPVRSRAALDRAAAAGHPQRVRADHLLDAAPRQQARWREHARHRVLAAGVLGGALHPGLRGVIMLAHGDPAAGTRGVVDHR